ncbi:histone methyltransferase set2 [Podochytrium sp. JEL0797]|nr:histone methyltransferase set2 [Podochytrium sp. JEL0797]
MLAQQQKMESQDLTQELTKVYTHIERNEYKGGAKGRIEDMEVMPCMCAYQNGERFGTLLMFLMFKTNPGDDPEMACGESSDCINRALFLECSADDCPCGYNCQNRRFWNKQYAPIRVIKTELKGYGLKATKALKRGQFVIEYCGEVIPQSMFLKRVREYSETGAKHFYFMSIKTDEVIDACKKGNIARFMNHSCVPNCELQKWVVGNQIRMGFFTVSDVAAGEELSFDYKFERYGAEPQICYCGHSECKGVIGGQQKTVINIKEEDDDEIDEEEEKLTAKPRRARSGSDDEDNYGDDREERGLQTVEAVKSFVKVMLYSTSKPTKLIRLLQKLEATQSVTMQRKFLQYHGLLVLKNCLAQHSKSNVSICYQTMRILKNMPPISRNAIVDSRIEDLVKKIVESQNSTYSVVDIGQELLETWSKFTTVYRIPKKASQPTDTSSSNSDTNSLKRSPDNQSDRPTPSSVSTSSAGAAAANFFYKRGKYESNSSILSPRSSSTSTEDLANRFDPLTVRSNSISSLPPRPSTLGQQQQQRPGSFEYGRSNSTPSLNPDNGGSMGANSRVVESVLDTLPKGWKVAKNDEGRLYYYNHALAMSRWDFPRDAATEGSPGEISVGSASAAAVVPEVRVKSSMIEGMDEADIEAIVQRATAMGGFSSPKDEEASIKLLRGRISELVVKTLSRYRETLGSDKFKKVARSCTHAILEREIRHKTVNDHKNGLSDDVKVAMKKSAHKFYKSFVEVEKKKK